MKVVWILTLVFVHADCFKILGLFPHPGKSHVDVFLPLMKALAEKGHEVTVIGYHSYPYNITRMKHISLAEEGTQFKEVLPIDQFYGKSYMKYITPLMLRDFATVGCEKGLNTISFQNFMKSDEKFDVVIMEFFNTDCFLGIMEKFQVPLIGFSTCTLMPWSSDRFGNPNHPAYIPNNLLDLSDKLNFIDRFTNTWISFFHRMFYDYFIFNNDKRLVAKHFDPKVPLEAIAQNSSLLLVNTHQSLNLARPFAPNIIEVGGIHIDREPQRLPEHLEKWINESTEGVIYFSLGSLIKGHTFPEDKKEAFLKAFARLPQRILWKWENDTMLGKPDNVMLSKWTPQFDVLCHPNVKAFISHGGLLGTIEAVHCGVPVMVMPQFGDQFVNSRALEANGGGIVMHLYDATEEKVYKNLKKLTSTSFRMKAKELSERFKDRPLPPMETAIYWVEYVVRHKGAHFLRTAAVNMPFYQYYLIDVFAFSFVLIAFTFYAFLLLTRCIIRKFASTSTKEKLKTK